MTWTQVSVVCLSLMLENNWGTESFRIFTRESVLKRKLILLDNAVFSACHISHYLDFVFFYSFKIINIIHAVKYFANHLNIT